MNADFVLLADDNSTDAELTTRALEIGGVSKNIVWVQDGEAALDFVFRTGPYAGRPSRNPRLMLLKEVERGSARLPLIRCCAIRMR